VQGSAQGYFTMQDWSVRTVQDRYEGQRGKVRGSAAESRIALSVQDSAGERRQCRTVQESTGSADERRRAQDSAGERRTVQDSA
jgi:hypothetical protein